MPPSPRRFQYQPLHEGLRPIRELIDGYVRFQYQPLHEGLLGYGSAREAAEISIPAPPRGASHAASTVGSDWQFQYQPLHEGLLEDVQDGMIEAIFQYQPLHEGLRSRPACRCRRPNFNTSPSTRGFGGLF